MRGRSPALWTFAVTSVALVMVMLDNLVVSTALNVIRQELGATLEQLEWTVNAYTLTFAVFLITGAALGDRFGRRRMFVIGVAIFTGLTAWDVQRLKNGAMPNIDKDSATVMGALALYLDFVNLFLFMLRIFGSSR